MDSNLISLLTLGIKLCPCLPVDMCSLLLCVILWLGSPLEVSCRIKMKISFLKRQPCSGIFFHYHTSHIT